MIGDTETAHAPTDVGKAGASSSPSGDVDVPAVTAQSLTAIEAEGDEARWQSAKEVARAVFQAPALVTSRRLALLGEEGLAAFVDETRAITRAFIRRERSQKGEVPNLASVGDTPEKAATPKSSGHRRPAAFRTDPPKVRSISERLTGWVEGQGPLLTFASDLVFGCATTLAAMAIGIVIFRFARALVQ